MQIVHVVLQRGNGTLPSFIDEPSSFRLNLVFPGPTQVLEILIRMGHKANLFAKAVMLRRKFLVSD